LSRGFICSLIGVAFTLLAWYGPWEWPAWPAFALLDLAFGTGRGYHELSNGGRAAVLVALIAANVGFWAAVAAALITVVGKARYRQ
jgi:hypothetical protein